MPLHIRLGLAVLMLCSGTVSPAAPKGDEALIQLLQTKVCRQCQLADVNLVHAQLQDADLEGAKLQRANLSQARLDGVNLRGADLSFTSLHGASLRGANLQGTTLVGTDLREVDLTGAVLDPNTLEQAHWGGAVGLQATTQSYAALHNAGVTAAESDRWSDAEELFGLAILKQPESAESWVARGISREQLENAHSRFKTSIMQASFMPKMARMKLQSNSPLQPYRFKTNPTISPVEMVQVLPF